MTDEPTREASTPAAPPTRPGPVKATPPESTWPNWIGIPAIIIGGLGVLGLAMQAVLWMFMPMMAAPMPADDPAAELLEPMVAWFGAMSLGGTVLSALLLAGGIGLVNRRRWSVRVLQAWAVLALVMVVVSALLMARMFSSFTDVMMQEMTAPPGAMPAGAPVAVGSAMIAVMTCGSALFGGVPPVFLLIWFARSKIRNEVAAWA